VNKYIISYSRDDMDDSYVGSTSKWAKDQNKALATILKKRPEKDGLCVFKRGGTGKILSITKIDNE